MTCFFFKLPLRIEKMVVSDITFDAYNAIEQNIKRFKDYRHIYPKKHVVQALYHLLVLTKYGDATPGSRFLTEDEKKNLRREARREARRIYAQG
jgi:hypothetical protein